MGYKRSKSTICYDPSGVRLDEAGGVRAFERGRVSRTQHHITRPKKEAPTTMTTTRKGVTLTKRQAEVYDVFTEFGVALPDHALVPLAQHASQIHQSSSGIRSRRCELARAGLLKLTGFTKTGSGRRAAVYEAV